MESVNGEEKTNLDYFLDGWNKAFAFSTIWNQQEQVDIAHAWESVGESMQKAINQVAREQRQKGDECNKITK